MTEPRTSENKRIAKNTGLLYIRTFVVLLVSLYTSRILLEALGISNYGVYNVVGGVVTMFTFMNAALGNASSRFITFALGRGDDDHTRRVFNASRVTHILMSIVIVILAETVGLWFLNTKMEIPDESVYAANWVYQFSIITTVLAIVSVPYNASLIAHENMRVFANVSILDVCLKLCVVFMIKAYGGDRLILYGLLMLAIQLIDRIIYGMYCAKHYGETKYMKVWDKALYKEMFSFSGWSLIGNLAVMCMIQGQNILLNIFFGPVVNAARGIAVQVQGAVKSFITNVQTAVNPQIIKNYAIGNISRLHFLIVSSSKFTFYLMLCIGLPVVVNCHDILHIWLDKVPQYTEQFTIITIGIILIDTLSNPLGIANSATGKIKKYQILEGGTLLLILPTSYVVLKLGGRPISVFWIQLTIVLFVQIIRIMIVCPVIKMPIRQYLVKLLWPISIVASITSTATIFLRNYIVFNNIYINCLSGIIMTLCITITIILILGLNHTEKEIVRTQLQKIIMKIKS